MSYNIRVSRDEITRRSQFTGVVWLSDYTNSISPPHDVTVVNLLTRKEFLFTYERVIFSQNGIAAWVYKHTKGDKVWYLQVFND